MTMINNICIFLYCKVQAFLKEERGAVDIVAVVVLIGIAVALAVVFRKAIGNVLNSLLNTISSKANEAVA